MQKKFAWKFFAITRYGEIYDVNGHVFSKSKSVQLQMNLVKIW